MKALLISLAAVATVGVGFATPAFATTGREAVNACIDKGPRCEWYVGDHGEIAISTGGTIITCPSADGKCSVVHFKAGLPPSFKKQTGPLSIGH